MIDQMPAWFAAPAIVVAWIACIVLELRARRRP